MRDPAVGPGFDDQSATPKKEGNPFGLPSFIAPAGVSRKADSNVDTSDTTTGLVVRSFLSQHNSRSRESIPVGDIRSNPELGICFDFNVASETARRVGFHQEVRQQNSIGVTPAESSISGQPIAGSTRRRRVFERVTAHPEREFNRGITEIGGRIQVGDPHPGVESAVGYGVR